MKPDYCKFEKLCKERGVTAADVARNCGVWASMFSDWKAGRSYPKTDNMAKVARFFGVSIESLLEEA